MAENIPAIMESAQTRRAEGKEPAFPLPLLTSWSGYPWLVVGTVCIGALMAALDASIVNVAMPTFLGIFRTGMSMVEWISIAYLLSLTAMLPVGGYLADRVGRRTLYAGGFIIFILGSALCGLSWNIVSLVVFRVIQAVGAAMLQANSIAIVTSAAPPGSKGKAIGIQGAAQSLGLCIGPLAGAFLLSTFGWRAIFYVNVPIGILGSLLAFADLPRDKVPEVKRGFDFAGISLLLPGLVLLTIVLQRGDRLGWVSPELLSLLAAGLVFLFFFWKWEKKAKSPILSPEMMHSKTLLFGCLGGFAVFSVMFGDLFLSPFYLEKILNYSYDLTGLFLIAVPLAMVLVAPVGGNLYDRFGARSVKSVGMASVCAGAGALVLLNTHVYPLDIILPLALIGIGQGLFTPANNTCVMDSAQKDRLATVGGMLNMARSLGMVFGIALGGTAYTMLRRYLIAKDLVLTMARLDGLRAGFLGLTLISLFGLAIAFFRSQYLTIRKAEGLRPQTHIEI